MVAVCGCPAQDCITDDPDQRPSMKEIVQRLLAVRDTDSEDKPKLPQVMAEPLMATADSVNSLHGPSQTAGAGPLAT